MTSTGYNIGAVSRLSGVSREKIRIWERRYGAVAPGRDDTNHRPYSRDDVERLILLRRLVDSGHAISAVAALDRPMLEGLLQAPATRATHPEPPDSVLLVAAADSGVEEVLAAAGIPQVQRVGSLAAADTRLDDGPVALLLAHLPTLLGSDCTELLRLRRRLPAARLVVVYRFAARVILDQLREIGATLVKAPLAVDDLWRLAPAPAAGVTPEPDARARRYSQSELNQLAARAEAVRCECPRHLVDLVQDLNAFEDYSLSCEVASTDDADLHREIYAVVARARALVEDALDLVADKDGIAD